MTTRPIYHITAPLNWLNDPNGPIHHDGRYHLFFQCNPVAPRWGRPHWGHVSSRDLVHWVDHPIALTPRADGPDRDGCWSGCLRVVNDQPLIFYTGVIEEDGRRIESVCVAEGTQDLFEWRPGDEPLVLGAPRHIEGGYHRDPFVFRKGEGWGMLLGSGVTENGQRSGALLLYESSDLADWQYGGIIYQRPEGAGPIDTGPLWECPQMVRTDGQELLIFSVQMEGESNPLRYAVYTLGVLGDDGFDAHVLGKVDHGDIFYAPAVTEDSGGRGLMWGWLQEKGDDDSRDHAGALSLPRELEVRDGRLLQRPVDEIVHLRTQGVQFAHLDSGQEIDVSQSLGSLGHFEFVAEATALQSVIEFRNASGSVIYRVYIDRAHEWAEITGDGNEPLVVPLVDTGGQPLRLRLFVDASIHELFLDDETVVTTRAYGPPATSIVTHGRELGPVLRDVELYALANALPGRASPPGRPSGL